jgi:hypothetical protein
VAAFEIVQGIAEEVVRGLKRGDGHAHLAGAIGLAMEEDVGALEREGGTAFVIKAQFPQAGALVEEVGPEVQIGNQNLHVLGVGQGA